MEDVGIPIPRLNPSVSGEVRIREEVDLDEKDGVSTPKQGEGGGGLFDNLIAKLSSPRASSKPSGVEAFEGGDAFADPDSGGNGGGGGGGVINSLLSGLFQNGRNDGDEGKKVNEVEGSEVANKDLGHESVGRISSSNGGSIISNLVPDEVAPAADEASILIHSVVHD